MQLNKTYIEHSLQILALAKLSRPHKKKKNSKHTLPCFYCEFTRHLSLYRLNFTFSKQRTKRLHTFVFVFVFFFKQTLLNGSLLWKKLILEAKKDQKYKIFRDSCTSERIFQAWKLEHKSRGIIYINPRFFFNTKGASRQI